MDANSERKIAELLYNRFNRWWSGQQIVVEDFRRRDFHYLASKIHENKVITLIGPRQIGKTTIIKQLIRHLIIDKGIEPKRILYVAFDDVELNLLSDNNVLLDVLEIYKKYTLIEDLNLINDEVYLFFDEVQRVDNWAESVKALHDANDRIHILATGSASFNISQKSKETLPGRQQLYSMFPLKFIDAMALGYYNSPGRISTERMSYLYDMRIKLRTVLSESLASKSFDGFFALCEHFSVNVSTYKTSIQAALASYMLKGGYPEIVTTKDNSQCQRLLTGYANDVIVKDLMPWFKIRDFQTAEKLLFMLAEISGETLNINELLNRARGSNYLTINKYIDYFESLNIVSRLPVYSGSRLGSAKHPKIYFCDVGLRNAEIGVLDSVPTATENGHLAETVAFDHIKRLAFKINASSVRGLSCFSSDKGEVDFIVDFPKYKIHLPIEVKFRKNVRDLKGLYEFLETKKVNMGLVLTDDTFDMKDKVMYIPLWMFLLIC